MSQERVIELEYSGDLLSHYEQLADLPGFVLLQSSDIGRGRYDILSAYPYSHSIVHEVSDTEEMINQLNQQLLSGRSQFNLPFQGGAIGYVSYDWGARHYGIQSISQPTLANMPYLHLAWYDWAIIADHYLKKVILFVANHKPTTNEIVNEICCLWRQKESTTTKKIVTYDFNPLIAKEDYVQSFIAVHQALKEGRSYQVNLTQPFNAPFKGDPWAAYRQISYQNPVPYSAFMRLDEAEILSFSPERFLLSLEGRIVTSPIKGSMGRSVNPKQDEALKYQLMHSPKNRAENVMIVDLLRNDLGKIALAGSVKVTQLCAVHSFKSVHHLISDIEAEHLTDKKPFDLFFSCFPGGSITGAPKLEAMRIINEQEPYGRGIYCGSIGYFSHHGRFDTNIAIRTITAKNNLLHLAAGGGIVIDSDCEEEYLECYTKISAIINGLK